MTKTQELTIKLSEARSKLNRIIEKRNEAGEMTDELREEMSAATKSLENLEVEYRAAVASEGEETRVAGEEIDAEKREFNRIEERAEFSNYVVAALENRGVDGAERELNQALGLSGFDNFPLSKLVDAGEHEERAAIDGDPSVRPRSWLDRLFNRTASARIGVSFPSVEAGVASFPVTTGGGSSVQRGRTQAVTDSTFTFTASELKPTRNAISVTYSIEDSARVPGLADAIMRDMRSALTESVDKAIFVGDSGANENTADITGFQTASIGETTLTQANKVKGDQVLTAFGNVVDGTNAHSVEELQAVVSIPAYQLWLKTIHNSDAENQTIKQFLAASGVDVGYTRGGLASATTNNTFGAYIGLGDTAGAAVAPVWMGAEMITDRYTGAKKGEVTLTLNYLWNFGIPRTTKFHRIKFVS